MPRLDDRGIIAAAQIAFYVPIASLTVLLLFRYALRRDAGWLYLFIFSLCRIAEGALLVAGELVTTPNVDLFIAGYTLQIAALGILLMSTLGFLGMVGYRTFSDTPRIMVFLRSLGVLALAGVGLAIAGGIVGTHVSPQEETGYILRRVASGVFGGFYVLVTLLHFVIWTYRWHLRSYRRHMLWGISLGLLPLGARVAYAILASWSAHDLFGTRPSSNSVLAMSNPVTGSLIMFLILSPIMEYLVVLIYLISSVILARRHRHRH